MRLFWYFTVMFPVCHVMPLASLVIIGVLDLKHRCVCVFRNAPTVLSCHTLIGLPVQVEHTSCLLVPFSSCVMSWSVSLSHVSCSHWCIVLSCTQFCLSIGSCLISSTCHWLFLSHVSPCPCIYCVSPHISIVLSRFDVVTCCGRVSCFSVKSGFVYLVFWLWI